MIVSLGDYDIQVIIKRKQNKNIYMRFDEEGNLVITCNLFVTKKEIESLIKKNEKALLRMLQKNNKKQEKERFFGYLGTDYIIVHLSDADEVTFNATCVFAKDQKMLDDFYRKECSRILTSEVNRIATYFKNIPEYSIRIRKMKTRWGVCNRANNTITLNSELLKKKIYLIDYVIIHELCHFYEANHSKRFWEHVEKYYPDYKNARKELNSYD